MVCAWVMRIYNLKATHFPAMKMMMMMMMISISPFGHKAVGDLFPAIDASFSFCRCASSH
jgi:hypothetical protein